MLPEIDVVSLHVPRLRETENMIAAAELARMKPTALVINTSRGGLIDEAALAAALGEGRIGGAGIDTFDEEPPRADNPLFASDRAILSPHIAGLTKEAMARLSVAAAENVLAGLDGRLDPALVVNAAVLGRGGVRRGQCVLPCSRHAGESRHPSRYLAVWLDRWRSIATSRDGPRLSPEVLRDRGASKAA